MTRRFAAVVLAFIALVHPTLAANCNADNCYRAAVGTVYGLGANRTASCSSFQACTVTPAPSYVYTSTVTSPAPSSGVTTPVTNCPSAVPSSASACSGTSRYASACSCGGVTMSYSSAAAPTISTSSNNFIVQIVGATGGQDDGNDDDSYWISLGANNDGITLIQPPPKGSSSATDFTFDGSKPNWHVNFFGIQHPGGYSGFDNGTDGDAVYYENPDFCSGCVRTSCNIVDGPSGPNGGPDKYVQCVGAQPSWTQTYICNPNDDFYWSYLFLGKPDFTNPACTPVKLRFRLLPKNKFAKRAWKVENGKIKRDILPELS